MLPATLEQTLAPYLDGPLRGCTSAGGGCIANASRIDTDTSHYFLKWGGHPVGHTFQAEAYGLNLLRKAGSPLVIPRVLAAGLPVDSRPGFLLLEWIDSCPPDGAFWEGFGRGLAELHRHTSDAYGAGENNFIGRLPQDNTRSESWPAFFRDRRLEPQVRIARERGFWQPAWDRSLESLHHHLEDILPLKPEASLLHGDLWGGNFMVTCDGRAALIDPAAYYGHREADLAMTVLFGGFQTRFYEAYEEAWPLDPGYPERRDLYNLYHLINHLNHFGRSYAGSVAAILERYS